MYDKSNLMFVSALAGMTALAAPAAAQIATPQPPRARPAAQPVQPQQPPVAQTQTTGESPSIAPGSAPAGYRIGVDDVLEVDVLGQSDFKTRAKVQSDGTVTLPYLGAVQVKGETSLTLVTKIQNLLKAGGYYAKPIVSVDIVSFVSNYVTVMGQVGSNGLQPIDRAYHVSEIIARAGGLKPDAADFVVLTRADGTSVKLNYKQLALGGPEDDPMIAAGDKIFVPEVERFYIYGQVNSPGVYPIKSDMNLQRALAQAGGLGPAGSKKRIKVTRDGQEIKLGMNDPIKPGDTIVIGERLF